MKKIFTGLLMIFVSYPVFSQGSIQSFTINPLYPTTADTVTVYVNLLFTNSQCSATTQSFATDADSTVATALHCLSATADSCYAVDTFQLGMLQGGMHHFRFELNSGFGNGTCTPGLLPDDIDSTSFLVSVAAGLSNHKINNEGIEIYPNPFHSTAILKIDPSLKLKDAELTIINVIGTTVKTITNIESNELTIDAKDLANGMYYFELSQNEKRLTNGRFIIE